MSIARRWPRVLASLATVARAEKVEELREQLHTAVANLRHERARRVT